MTSALELEGHLVGDDSASRISEEVVRTVGLDGEHGPHVPGSQLFQRVVFDQLVALLGQRCTQGVHGPIVIEVLGKVSGEEDITTEAVDDHERLCCP